MKKVITTMDTDVQAQSIVYIVNSYSNEGTSCRLIASW